MDWASILITTSDAKVLRSRFEGTWEKWKHILQEVSGGVSWEDTVALDATAIWWISGSTRFCDLHLEGIGGCPRVACRSGERRTPPCTLTSEWYQISHHNVGGSTNARGTFCLTNLPKLEIPRDLPRNLDHVIKHSIRGEPCSLPLLEPRHYAIGDRLTLGKITQPVLLQSFYSRSGWAKRPLAAEELEMAFDLPDCVRWEPTFVSLVPPLQILRAVMEGILSRQPIETCDLPPKRLKLIPSDKGLNDDRHWIPSLGRWLPGSWADTEISDKAVKSDDADIDFFPWNQRIMLVLPWISSRAIRIMEHLCYIRWCRFLTSSFRRYLRSRYDNYFSEL